MFYGEVNLVPGVLTALTAVRKAGMSPHGAHLPDESAQFPRNGT